MIELRGLSKHFGEKHVLDDINYCFEKGSIHGIVGLNGVGKTTLFNCMVGLLSYNGKIILSSNSKIGFLPTQVYLYPKTTGIEFIEFCLSVHGMKIDYEEITSINELFKLPLKEEYTRNYSDGMKKKLSILILLLQKNDILILDEPFNNLDIETNLILIEVLKQLRKDKTILVSSHIIDPLKAICDNVILLHDSKFQQSYKVDDFEKIEAFFSSQRKDNITQIIQNL
jgi:ABC-2 type transport system ATP-binding protein